MKHGIIKASIIGALCSLLSVGGAFAASFTVVNSNDSGAGSLREALQQASGTEEANAIYIQSNGHINIKSPLIYSAQSPLFLFGQNQTIKANEDFTLLTISEGADLSVEHLKFQGPGGFDINNRADLDGNKGKGIFIDVRDTQTGVLKLVLHGVRVSDVGGHGVHVFDCTIAKDAPLKCGEGYGGAGVGSDASISISMNGSSIINVGMGGYDADGLRVDERGLGDINASIVNSQFLNNGADGVEFDEGQEGSVIMHAVASKFNNNGIYCDVSIMKPFMPSEDEGEFEDNQVKPADIISNLVIDITEEGKYNGAIKTGSPDDGCLETEVKFHDSGFVEEFEIAIDTDDGVDIDEAGEGDISGQIFDSEVNANADEGFDIDELNAGGIFMTINNTIARDNSDDGFKHSEEDAGSVVGQVENSIAKDNGGKGFVFEEENEGNVFIMASDVATSNNDDSDDTGMELVQDDEGSGAAYISDSSVEDGFDISGLDRL